MSNIWVAIPIIDKSFDYSKIISSLKGEYVIDEQSDHPNKGQDVPNYSNKIILIYRDNDFSPIEGTTQLIVDGEINISKMWNAAILEAKNNNASHLTFLNYIKEINPFIIEESVNSNIDEQMINIADGSVFVINLSNDIFADEQFRFYFADVDLFKRTNAPRIVTEYYGIEYFDMNDFAESLSDITAQDGINFENKYS